MPFTFDTHGMLQGDHELTIDQLKDSLLVRGPIPSPPSWDAAWRLKLVDNLEIWSSSYGRSKFMRFLLAAHLQNFFVNTPATSMVTLSSVIINRDLIMRLAGLKSG